VIGGGIHRTGKSPLDASEAGGLSVALVEKHDSLAFGTKPVECPRLGAWRAALKPWRHQANVGAIARPASGASKGGDHLLTP